MLVLCGIPSEPPLQAVIEAAERRAIPHAVLNQREASHSDMTLYQDRGRIDGVLRIRERDIPLSGVRGVYLRLMDQEHLPESRSSGKWSSGSIGQTRSSVLHAALTDWLEVARCRVLNRTSSMASNLSKPYQAQHILRAGFKVPETIVTNDPETVRAFMRRHARIVYKSTSSVRSIVDELGCDRLHELDRIRYLPTQFQQYIAGANVRVHTVGSQVFATEIRSDVVDYRYASRQGAEVSMRSIDLPASVTDRCLTLSQELQLPLAGIDLIRTPEQEYYCLEVNPSPAYTFYQEQTGQPISDAIVRYLMDG